MLLLEFIVVQVKIYAGFVQYGWCFEDLIYIVVEGVGQVVSWVYDNWYFVICQYICQ